MVKNDAAAVAAAAGVTAQLDWAMQTFGVSFTTLMAGFAGALIALWLLPPTKRWYIPLVIGTIIAAYMTPFVAGIFWKYTALGEVDKRPVAFMIGISAHFFLTLFFTDGREIIVGALRSLLRIEGKPK